MKNTSTVPPMQQLNHLFLTTRFFWAFGSLVLLFALSFVFPLLFPLSKALLVLLAALTLLDFRLLFSTDLKLEADRKMARAFSLGDPNPVKIELHYSGNIPLFLSVIDELPPQLQIRNFEERLQIAPGETTEISYNVHPVVRGAYHFGNINIYASTRLALLQKRFRAGNEQRVPVYPSIIQMKKYELSALNHLNHQKGIKKIRRIGHSYEFEQIKNYVRGDDYRSINWKASSRKGSLMVNQYEDERAQQVYCIIDKSRVMRMPFRNMSLMDHSINAALAISNIILKKHDRAGLITFSDKMGTTVKADSKPFQLQNLLQALYKEKERSLEANYELLYYATRKLVKSRSLLLLFTNFESAQALERTLPILRYINGRHLLVVIFFENTEISAFSEAPATDVESVYYQTIARKFVAEKRQMVQQLKKYGIQAILTPPETLTLQTVNKYLELKSRGLI